LEAVGHGGHVEVAVRRVQGEVEVSVADDGPGIPAAQRRHLFDPFYSARQAGRGLGMGLAKCWRIVTNHGGRIEVDSTPGRGATLLVRLPVDGPPQP
jgi:signal transduction histidine kinase